MTDTKYYPAYLLNDQEYDDPASCLDARGVAREQAQQFIERAQQDNSEIVVRTAESSADDFFLLVAEDDGKWRTWAARANAIQDTREQAERLVESFGHDVEWRVFGMRQQQPL